jgi:NAD(P)-dependent dehydrogenase (short-subunit alcohol dehydrogenase family)
MPTVLISGANRGIGLELARQYSRLGWRVLGCARDIKRADKLSSLGKGVEVLPLDVVDDGQIAALARRLKDEAIDVLLNNAGIYGGSQSFGKTDADAWLQVMRVNCIAPLHVAEAFVDHVARSQQRKIVSITSRMGSIGDQPGGDEYAYRTSKAALNMAMVNASAELKPRGIAVAVLHPGWVRTDMGGSGAPLSTEESATGIIKVIEALDLGRTGGFWDYQGKTLPW